MKTRRRLAVVIIMIIMLVLIIAATAISAAEPPGAVHLADLESRARLHNPAMAAAEAALRTVDAQLRASAADPALTRKLARTRSELLVERERMLAKLRTLFFHTLANQRRLESRERLAGLAREAAGVTDQLFNVGAADSPDRLAIENEARVLDAALADARFELEQMRAVLAETAGEPEPELGTLEGDLFAGVPEIDPEHWRRRLLRESPSLLEMQAEIVQAEAALARARRARKGTPATPAAEAAVAQARLRAEQIRITLEVGFAETYAGYQSGLRKLAMYRGGVLERAERAYRENLDHYRQMTAAYPQVLVAQRNWLQMEDAALDAAVQAWSAAIDIQALLSYELPQNLAPSMTAPAAPAPEDGEPGTTRRPPAQ
jgi:outer membrane protein, heavy metal efflux system